MAIVAATALVLAHRARTWGGTDNYFYLLYANDLAEDAATTSWERYFYFPGTYSFWRVIAEWASYDIAAYQSGYVGICITNAAAVALILRFAGCNAVVAAASFWAYVSWGHQVGMQSMTTEAICTAPVLIGILLWLAFTRWERPMAGWVSLGIGYGLGVFTKQQGAFVAFGAIGILLGSLKRPFAWRIFRDLAIVIVAALVIFACAFVIDGGGLRAFLHGVSTARSYQAFGDLWHNIFGFVRNTYQLSSVFGVALLTGVVAHVLSVRKSIPVPPTIAQLWGLAGASALVPLYQFSRRAYDHYMLLSLPFVIITLGLAALWLYKHLVVPLGKSLSERIARAWVRRLSKRPATAEPATLLPGGLLQCAFWGAVVLYIGADLREKYRTASTLPMPHVTYAVHCRDIVPGKRLLLLPSKINAVHWACKTHARGTKWGYSFNYQENPQDYVAEIQKADLEQVFVFDTRPGSYEQQIRARSNWSPFFAELDKQGFKKVRASSLGTLYKRSNQ